MIPSSRDVLLVALNQHPWPERWLGLPPLATQLGWPLRAVRQILREAEDGGDAGLCYLQDDEGHFAGSGYVLTRQGSLRALEMADRVSATKEEALPL